MVLFCAAYSLHCSESSDMLFSHYDLSVVTTWGSPVPHVCSICECVPISVLQFLQIPHSNCASGSAFCSSFVSNLVCSCIYFLLVLLFFCNRRTHFSSFGTILRFCFRVSSSSSHHFSSQKHMNRIPIGIAYMHNGFANTICHFEFGLHSKI